MADLVLRQQQGAVLTLTLNRPDAMNALTYELLLELRDALADAVDPAIRCVVVTGAGRGFCAGQDIGAFASVAGELDALLEQTYHPVIRALRGLEKPVIAGLNGAVAGAGLSLALACDLRFAADNVVVVPGFSAIALVPDAGATWALTDILGAARAFEWMCSNRRLSAAEALECGLVSDVVAAAEFPTALSAYAERWAAGPTRAFALTKQLFEHARSAQFESQIALEARFQTEVAATSDFAAGVAAFLARTPPTFTGG